MEIITPESHRPLRILALDVRPRKIGFAVFEGPNQLLDWGVKQLPRGRKGQEVEITKKLGKLLDIYSPSAIVMRRKLDGSSRSKKARKFLISRIRMEARQRSVLISFISTTVLRKFFNQHGCLTKPQIASKLASWFEHLHWKLPPKRKAWHGEHRTVPIFDAAAVGVVYFATVTHETKQDR